MTTPSHERSFTVAILAMTCTMGGCPQALPGPVSHVVTASPIGTVDPADVRVEITLSSPVAAAGLEDGRFIALCREDEKRELTRLLEREMGLAKEEQRVAALVTLEEAGKRIVLRPVAPLEPNQAWVAILSRRIRSADGRPVLDAEGRARSFSFSFRTGPTSDRTPPIPRWVIPPHGPAPANLARIRVAFDEPITGLLGLPEASGTAAATAISIGDDELGLDLASSLPPGPLQIDLSAVKDLAGNTAIPLEPITISRCSVAGAPIEGEPEITPGELSVKVEARLRGMGRLLLEFSAGPGTPGCGRVPEESAPSTVAGGLSECPGWDPCRPEGVVCQAELELRGLCPGIVVRGRLLTEDLAGQRTGPGPWFEVKTNPPRPLPVVTEVLADAEAPEAGGEFVEIANLGSGAVDLAGYELAKRTASGGFTRCEIVLVSGEGIAPGAHAIVVGGSYDGRYESAAGLTTYQCGTKALAGGLANDRPVELALEDPSGQVMSTVGIVEPVVRCSGGALERIHPEAGDAAGNWSCPGLSTPGECNRSTPPAECPTRPW